MKVGVYKAAAINQLNFGCRPFSNLEPSSHHPTNKSKLFDSKISVAFFYPSGNRLVLLGVNGPACCLAWYRDHAQGNVFMRCHHGA
jgi:hypothetical protein